MKNKIQEEWLIDLIREHELVAGIETDSTGHMIRGKDGSAWKLSPYEVTNTAKSADNEKADNVRMYADNHTKAEFVGEIMEMAEDNFYTYIILISLLKLKELEIINLETADRLFEQVIPFSDQLKSDFLKTR